MSTTIDAYDHYAFEGDYPDLDVEGACARLAQALACKTIYTTAEGTDFAPFDDLQAHLRASFPHVFAAAEVELVGHSMLMRVAGTDPDLPGILLMAHQDVVPVAPGTEADWTHDAFAGVYDGEFVWGRGAIDIKDMLMGELEALDYLLARDFAPERDVWLAFGEDEEVRSTGAVATAARLGEKGVRLAFLLDEGTTTLADGSAYGAPGTVVSDICLSQKGYLDLRIRAKGTPGHSSNPFGGTSLEHLSCALAKVSAARPSPQLSPALAEAFRALGDRVTQEPLASLARDPKANAQALADACANVRELYPLVATTMAVDQLEGGSAAANVMPGDVTATINFRLLPGTTAQDVVDHVTAAIDDPTIEVEIAHSTPAGRMDSVDDPFYQRLKAILERRYPGIAWIPSIVCGSTDAIRYEAVCPTIVRVLPFRSQVEEEAQGLHGTNERISRRTYAQGIRVLIDLVRECAGPARGM